MTICTKCGAPVPDGGAFCGSCGASAGTQTGAAPLAAASPLPAGAAPVPAATVAPIGTGLSMNLAAALSYSLGLITGILFLVLEPWKSNRFVRFHAMQSVLFCVGWIVISIVWSIAVGIVVNFTGFWILTVDVPLRLLFGLGIFLVWLYLMFQAYSQREYRLPWIGDIAAKQLH